MLAAARGLGGRGRRVLPPRTLADGLNFIRLCCAAIEQRGLEEEGG